MKKFFKWFVISVLSLIVALTITVVAFVNLAPAFGEAASGESLERILQSKHYDGEKFVNLVETVLDTSDPENSPGIGSFIYDFFNPPVGKNPKDPLPSDKFDATYFKNGDFVWLGHSTIIMKLNDAILVTDPVFYNASPVPGTAKPFEVTDPTLISDLPSIDAVLISHDHYDHLDYKAIVELKEKAGRFFVPLGIKAHLTSWGIEDKQIEEMEWYESTKFRGLDLIMTPSRHFSGRGLTNRYSTLWCSWVIQSSSDSTSVFFSGDSGYFDEFKKIGEQYGPFDIAFMENGAYDKDWSQIHFMPGENVQAAIDLRAKHMFGIHWGKYDLARHNWDTPIILADSISAVKDVSLVTPIIGEVFDLEDPPTSKWWRALR